MTDRPIIFSAPMVTALLDGRKSQTRRVLKPQPEYLGGYGDEDDPEEWGWIDEDGMPLSVLDISPNGYRKGDRLWVREHWYTVAAYDDLAPSEMGGEEPIRYNADGTWQTWGYPVPRFHSRFRQGIHMPRWASRLTLVVTDVRVQRLRDITEADAIREGVTLIEESLENPRDAFALLWNSIHGPDAWDANPWVAAISFETHRCNIGQMPEDVE